MTCEEARQLIGADPENASAELLAHLQTCAECQANRQQMLVMNTKLRRALELDWQKMQKSAASKPVGGPTPAAVADQPNVTVLRPRSPPPVPKQKRPGLMAFAASVAAASVAALVLWLSRPPETLAAEIVKHVEGEPNSWSKTEPVAVDRLKAVLRKSGVRLGPGMESIVYANPCWFRGHFVPHLVVMTPDGPATVMILVNEKVGASQKFNENGFSGLLVPAPTGSVAVLSRAPMPLDQAANTVIKALEAADQGSASTALPSRL